MPCRRVTGVAKGRRRRFAVRPLPRGAFVLALAFLAGCAPPQTARLMKAPAQLPPKVELTNVPFFPQEAYQCGPASLAMALAWSGVSVRPEDLVAQVYSPAREGTLPTEMMSASRRHGRVAYPVSTLVGLATELAAGTPVVVLQNLGPWWWSRGHWAIVVGYDRLLGLGRAAAGEGAGAGRSAGLSGSGCRAGAVASMASRGAGVRRGGRALAREPGRARGPRQ